MNLTYICNIHYSQELPLGPLVGGIAKAALLVSGPDLYVTTLPGSAFLVSEGETIFVCVFEHETDTIHKDAVKVTYQELFDYSLQEQGVQV